LHRPINIDDLLTEIFIMRFRIFIPVIFSERDVRQYLQEVDKMQHATLSNTCECDTFCKERMWLSNV